MSGTPDKMLKTFVPGKGNSGLNYSSDLSRCCSDGMSGSRNFLRLAIVAVGLMGLIATKSVSAQLATTQSTITLSSSESAWVNLQMLSGPVVLNGNAAPTDPVAALTMQADQFWQASVLAGQFLSVYPGDSLTSDAKKAQVSYELWCKWFTARSVS